MEGLSCYPIHPMLLKKSYLLFYPIPLDPGTGRRTKNHAMPVASAKLDNSLFISIVKKSSFLFLSRPPSLVLA